MQFKKWSRINPKSHKKIDFARLDMLFDGDHALGNRFTVRSNNTIEDVIRRVEEKESFLKTEKEFEESLEEFKAYAAIGTISINLKDVNDKLFYESTHMDEFWRVAFEIYQNQK